MVKTRHEIALFIGRGLTPAVRLCLGLSMVGCLAVFNATFHLAEPYRFVGLQLLWLPPAALLMVSVAAMPPWWLKSIAVAGSFFCFALLLAVLFFGVGINGMRGGFSWQGFFLQPGELAKPFFVLSLALVMQKTDRFRDDWLLGCLPPLALVAIWMAPLLLQPDLGTALVYLLTFIVVFLCLGGRVHHLGFSLLFGLPLLALLLRFAALIDSRWSALADLRRTLQAGDWHVEQFQQALAAGGLWGQAMGPTIEEQLLLPVSRSPSIVASLGQAMGLLGLTSLLLLLMAWVVYGWRRGRQAAREGDGFRVAAILGATAMVAVQACLHLSTSTGLLPPLEVRLPLLGYGGSSLLAVFALVGILECLGRPLFRPSRGACDE